MGKDVNLMSAHGLFCYKMNDLNDMKMFTISNYMGIIIYIIKSEK